MYFLQPDSSPEGLHDPYERGKGQREFGSDVFRSDFWFSNYHMMLLALPVTWVTRPTNVQTFGIGSWRFYSAHQGGWGDMLCHKVMSNLWCHLLDVVGCSAG